MSLFVVQYISIDTCFNRCMQHEVITKVIRVTSSAEPYLGSHQPELLQVVVDRPLTHPQLGGQLTQAAGFRHPYQPVHPVDPLYIADH